MARSRVDPDTDSDGLPDGIEGSIQTSPLVVDTDGDGFGDADTASMTANGRPVRPQ